MIIALACGIAISFCMASISNGKIVARWHSLSYEAKFAAKECGGAFEATRTFPNVVKHLKPRQPAVGVSVLDPQGNRVAKVSSVRVKHLHGGGWKVVWKATPGLECPTPLPPEPTFRWCSALSEGFAAAEACERQKEEEAKRWEEETAAHREAETEYRRTWGTGLRHVKTHLAHFAYKFFTKTKVVRHPPSAPCDELICEAKHALFRTLEAHYEMTTTSASCHQLTALKVHCYFSGLTREDIRNGNIAGHKGDAYVTKFPDGFDVQVVSFYPG
jgi:hypothetical protein